VPAERIRVEVAYCPRPGTCERVMLELDVPVTLADALHASGLVQRHGWDPQTLRVGIWGRAQPLQAPLRDQDRVEIYRPLVVDPKEARRLRYRRQREDAAG
jgi:putative ubiquitin-RnfH superfamily antitoxin RatB of RatAB toxin-antitoxin module